MKELRFEFQGSPIRVLFAFDHKRQGVLILGGDKSSGKRWYQTNIAAADKLYSHCLNKLEAEDRERAGKEQDNG